VLFNFLSKNVGKYFDNKIYLLTIFT